jgi:release factor glutamine methyltransferase
MTIELAYRQILADLSKMYEERESAAIANWVMDHVTGKSRIDRMLVKNEELSILQLEQLQTIQQQLSIHRPIQYVLGEAWFCGMKFTVNEHTLIPRPETEELVEWIWKENPATDNLLDIGTGSGCIPIALYKKFPNTKIISIDISQEALNIARQNADSLNAIIQLVPMDFLQEDHWDSLPQFDIIVSNPPYIRLAEKENMNRNVLDFEPGLALFVPDEDPLLFYRKIAAFARNHLSSKGAVYLEINEALGKEVCALYETEGYTVVLKKDVAGRDRMVKAIL